MRISIRNSIVYNSAMGDFVYVCNVMRYVLYGGRIAGANSFTEYELKHRTNRSRLNTGQSRFITELKTGFSSCNKVKGVSDQEEKMTKESTLLKIMLGKSPQLILNLKLYNFGDGR